MRDTVEIGMGRTARRTYELDEINIVPSRRTRSSQDVSTAWQLDAYRFEIPVVAHPTDALASPEFAIEMGRLGGLGVLNGEGLIGRHADVEEKIAQVLEAAEKEPEPSAAARPTHRRRVARHHEIVIRAFCTAAPRVVRRCA